MTVTVTTDRHLYLALTNAAEGRDDDFNRWYDTYHLPEVVGNVPGFVSGRRFALDPLQRTGVGAGEPAGWRYLAVYEVESDDLAETFAGLTRHRESVGFTEHDGALDPEHVAWLYTPCGPAATAGRSLGDEEHVFLALTNPAAGREQDMNAWYDVHVPEIVERMPGFVAGRRYEAHPQNQRPGQQPRWRYLALYDLEGDLAEIHRGDAEVRSSGVLTPADGAFDASSFGVWVFTPLGARVTEAELASAPA
jgi:hypothetical protein